MSDVPAIRLPELSGGQRASWQAFVEIAPRLGSAWLLVGGQMVLLHEIERGTGGTRPTDDVDVVIDLRVNPPGLTLVHAVLTRCGFEQAAPNADGIAHRYVATEPRSTCWLLTTSGSGRVYALVPDEPSRYLVQPVLSAEWKWFV